MFVSRSATCFAVRVVLFSAVFSAIFLLPAKSVFGQPLGLQPGEAVEDAPVVVPQICKAIAVKKDGKVSVQVMVSEVRLKQRDPKGQPHKNWIRCWRAIDPLTLGGQVRAYRPSGEKLDDTSLLKALANSSVVVCFQRTHKGDPEKPDPSYCKLFAEDSVLLVFEAKYWLRE